VYNALAVPIFLYGREIYILRQKEWNGWYRLWWNFSEEQQCRHFLTTKKNEEILEELEVDLVNKKLRRYKSDWLQHVTRMSSNRMAKIVMNCRPSGWRCLGRTLRRLLDETETG
jgi:hypothetical protein